MSTQDVWYIADPFNNPPPRGSVVRVRDGRVGFVTYHGLDGYGLRWKDSDETQPPEALLREPYNGAQAECVGREFQRAFVPHKTIEENVGSALGVLDYLLRHEVAADDKLRRHLMDARDYMEAVKAEVLRVASPISKVIDGSPGSIAGLALALYTLPPSSGTRTSWENEETDAVREFFQSKAKTVLAHLKESSS